MLKRSIIVLSLLITAALLTACGSTGNNSAAIEAEPELVGTLAEIMDSVYKNADLSQDFRDSMSNFVSEEIPADSAEYLIGTADVAYDEGLISMSMINVQAYQCILLRLPEDADIETVKQTIADHADPGKWICVEAESVIVENVGDVILFVMADTETAEALRASFLGLAQGE